jgi:hypothetical protein
MIAHFQAHRAEFEELVHRYRTFIQREHWPELKWPREENGAQESWKEYECVYRPIDAHWFLRLCNGH